MELEKPELAEETRDFWLNGLVLQHRVPLALVGCSAGIDRASSQLEKDNLPRLVEVSHAGTLAGLRFEPQLPS